MANLSQIKLKQIAGGLTLQSDIDALKASYDAAKVLTTVVKTPAVEADPSQGIVGSPAVNYNADELLLLLNNAVKAIQGDGSGTSLTSLQAAVDAINSKVVKDIVKLTLTAEVPASSGDPFTVTMPPDLADIVPSVDTSQEYPVYLMDNTPVYDATGEQLTFDFTSNTLTDVPYKAEVSQRAVDGTTERTVTYVPMTETFDFKVFPVGSFTFNTLPENYLLDNNEMQTVVIDKAINGLAAQLATDGDLINDIKKAIGETAIQNALKDVTQTLDARIAALEGKDVVLDEEIVKDTSLLATDATTASDVKVISEKVFVDVKKQTEDKITAVDTKVGQVATDINLITTGLTNLKTVVTPKIEYPSIVGDDPVSSFTLGYEPNDTEVVMVVNGITYSENHEFTVDRAAKTVTWTNTAAANGFDIDKDDVVKFVYYTGTWTDPTENTNTVKYVSQEELDNMITVEEVTE